MSHPSLVRPCIRPRSRLLCMARSIRPFRPLHRILVFVAVGVISPIIAADTAPIAAFISLETTNNKTGSITIFSSGSWSAIDNGAIAILGKDAGSVDALVPAQLLNLMDGMTQVAQLKKFVLATVHAGDRGDLNIGAGPAGGWRCISTQTPGFSANLIRNPKLMRTNAYALSVSPQDQTPNNPPPNNSPPPTDPVQRNTGETSITVMYAEMCNVDVYGQMLTVYANTSNKIDPTDPNRTKITPAPTDRYFFCPRPVVLKRGLERNFQPLKQSWEKWLEEWLEKRKKDHGDKSPPYIPLTIDVPVSFKLPDASREIAAALSRRYGAPITADQIEPVPLNGYEIYWAPSPGTGSVRVLYRLPESGGDIQAAATLVGYNSGVFTIRLTGRYDEIAQFVQAPNLGAVAYVAATQARSAGISIAASYLASSEFQNSLNGDGSLTQSYTVSTSADSGSGGFSFAGFSLGGSDANSNATGTSNVSRFVSRNCVVNAIKKAESTLAIKEIVTDGEKIDDIQQLLIADALNSMHSFTAEFVENDKHNYDLIDMVTKDAIQPNMTLSSIAAGNKGAGALTTSQEHMLEGKGIKESDKDALGLNSSNDVSWSLQGGLEVPSTIRLYAYSHDAFVQSVNSSFLRTSVTRTEAVFETVSGTIVDETSEFLPPDIGTIIASLVPWEKTTVEFRREWCPADGRAVKGSRFEALTGTSTVPDLRGLFLRGLNYSEANVIRKDGWEDPDAGRIPGSGQKDALQDHWHYENVDASRDWPNSGKEGTAVVASHEFKGGERKSRGVEGANSNASETRPKNAAVFYYVRIN